VNGHHDVVHDLVTSEWSSIMGLQETKCDVFSDYDIMQLLGRGFDYYFLPMIQTHGGSCLHGERLVGRHPVSLAVHTHS
jgi:hypothetical protein